MAPETAGVSKQRTGFLSLDKLGGGRVESHDYREGEAMKTFVFCPLSQGRKPVKSLSQVKLQAVDSIQIILFWIAKSLLFPSSDNDRQYRIAAYFV